MSVNHEKPFTFKQRGKGIRKNLTTYFTVRLVQGFALTILFYYFLNATGERHMEWKYVFFTFPAWSVLGTMLFESIRVIIEEQIRLKRERQKVKKRMVG